jgi:Uncharacterised protein family (UPF0236)
LNSETILTPLKKEEVMYIQADGSMLLTREDGWKEAKLGRIFKSSDCIHAGEKQGWISNSQYVCHLGGHEKFKEQMEDLIDKYRLANNKIVFISDGAPWLKIWMEAAYPGAVLILDFYHALEYLHAFSKVFFKDKIKEQKWIEQQKKLLLNGKVVKVIETVTKLKSSKKEAKKLIDYFQSNKDRMAYNEYIKLGIGLIGSGAIESAHRTVLQKRMKQSGQRWTVKGAQNMINLRVVKSNNQWTKVVELTKTQFKKAA